MKGVTHRDADEALWQALLQVQSQVRDYVAVLGLELVLDEAEGYAYLHQRPQAPGDPELPRLVPRRPLGYHVSLLLVALRKRLAEFDAKSGDTRLVLGRAELVELVRVLLPESVNDAKFLDRMDTHVNKVVELGFLRRLRGQDDRFEVQRILKAFVDAEWLSDFDQRLAAYLDHATEVGR
ncbi:MAG: DUF4194 domain-containing protein [Polyangiaceae bacterium]|nr:DUF4194 domain-containing protein [Polyangiaceae bacterium]